MIDETTGAGWPEAQTSTPNNDSAGFCQDCGKPLTAATARPIGNSLFCEPCLQVRLQGGAPAPGYSGSVVPPAATGDPSPTLAGFLGLIPGVGAMYNGQFSKGVAHIVIFAILVSIANNVSSGFGIFVCGWIAYQVIEAIHTARARRDGTPLPNAFGLNDIGDRIGFGKNWPSGQTRPVGTPMPPSGWTPAAAQAASADTPPPTDWTAVPPVPPPYVPPANWAGYVPPTHFGDAYASPTADAQGTVNQANAQYAAYQNFYAGQPAGSAPVPPMPPIQQPSRFPVAAVLLIGLGVLFLVGDLLPEWHFSGRWLLALLFAILGVYSLMKRISCGTASGLRAFRTPIVLLFFSVLFALQAANIRTLGQTWPLILILAGVLALMDQASFLRAPAAWPPPFTPTEPATPANSGISIVPATTVEAGTESHTQQEEPR